jgi:hypothetical protein
MTKDKLIKARDSLNECIDAVSKNNGDHVAIWSQGTYQKPHITVGDLRLYSNALDAQIKACDVPVITERGWDGHFICGHRCLFRRNTLIDYGDGKIVVSTVGNMRLENGKQESIGAFDRHYETMAFVGVFENGYWEADVSEQITFESPCSIFDLEHETDGKANDMHDTVVKELSARAYHKLTGGDDGQSE